MSFNIVRNDITEMKVCAIVNSANPKPIIGKGVDFMIHKKSGPNLIKERKKIGNIDVGSSSITKGYNLKAKHIIHTVGPVWVDGLNDEYLKLASCYQSSLNLALKHNLKSIAFPLISTGTYGFPKDIALDVAVNTIRKFLYNNDMIVYLVVYDEESYELSNELYEDVSNYINLNIKIDDIDFTDQLLSVKKEDHQKLRTHKKIKDRTLKDIVNELDDTFVQTIFRLTDDKGLTDVELYKKANIDRRLFSKIKSDISYHPSKMTAISLIIALELNLDETKDLLGKAGYALSPSKEFDLIIQYFIENENYDLYEINQVLFKFKQKIL